MALGSGRPCPSSFQFFASVFHTAADTPRDQHQSIIIHCPCLVFLAAPRRISLAIRWVGSSVCLHTTPEPGPPVSTPHMACLLAGPTRQREQSRDVSSLHWTDGARRRRRRVRRPPLFIRLERENGEQKRKHFPTPISSYGKRAAAGAQVTNHRSRIPLELLLRA
jgi:hypothetical protein